MTYISTRKIIDTEESDNTSGEGTDQAPIPLKLADLAIEERYLDIMSGNYKDAEEYASACSGYALNGIACIGVTRKHGLHEQLNTIISRLNEMEKLLAAIARNTQAITYTKTTTTEV